MIAKYASPYFGFVSLFTREWIEILADWIYMHHVFCVSLFTREWIEIKNRLHSKRLFPVSLFTREWIEIIESLSKAFVFLKSPSLRGSGLK